MKSTYFILIAIFGINFLTAQNPADLPAPLIPSVDTSKEVADLANDARVSDSTTQATKGHQKETMILLRESDVLTRLNLLPIYSWKNLGDPARHIGPLPADFYKLFEVGTDAITIELSDAIGVSLAGVKALSGSIRQYDKALMDQQKIQEDLLKKTNSLERTIERQKKEIELLKRQMAEVMAKIPR
jgi:hypothetical protein